MEKAWKLDLDYSLHINSLKGNSNYENRKKRANSLGEKAANFYENNGLEKAIETFLDAVKITPGVLLLI